MKWLTIAALLLASTAANAQVVPPKEYDSKYHPFKGTITVTELGSMAEIWEVCKGSSLYACSTHDLPVAAYCKIYTLKSIAKNQWMLRHEIAHCNGWPGDHPGVQNWPKNMTPEEWKAADELHRTQKAEREKAQTIISGLSEALAKVK